MKWIGQHIVDFIARFRSDVYLEEIANPGSDTDKFLVADATTGKVGFRTGANVLSDIGASSESTDLEFNGSTANGVLTYGGAAQIDVESKLTFDGSTLSIEADANTTANALFIDANSLTTGAAIYIDVDDATADSTVSDMRLMQIVYDKSANNTSGTRSVYGISIEMDDDATGNTANTFLFGLSIDIDAANEDGIAGQTGVVVDITGGDSQYQQAFFSRVEDGGVDFKSISSANNLDYFTIGTTTNGATTLTTVDADATAAHFEIEADGNITLDANGQIKLEPVAGSNILLDGTVTVDGGAIGGLASLTSSDDLSIVATGNDINVDTDNFTIESATAHSPYFTLKSTENGADGGHIRFLKDRGAAAVNNDDIGSIDWVGENDAQEGLTYGNIIVSALEVDDTDEAGRMTFKVAESNGSVSHQTAGLIIEGSDNTTDGEVNVTIGAGAASVATIAGTLTMGSTATINNSGVIQVAAQTVIDHDQLANFAANEHYTQANIVATGALDSGSITSGFTSIDVGAGGITTTGAISGGTIDATTDFTVGTTVITDDSIVMTPSTNDTFTIAAAANGATTLTTVDTAATAAHFEIAADGDITLDAAGDIALEAGIVNFTGDSSSVTVVNFINNSDDDSGPKLSLKNLRDGNGLEDGDALGTIGFQGADAAGGSETYGSIVGSVVEADHGDEAGQIAIFVANDGTERNGITMTADKGTAEEVDVTIANGAASTTTVAGDLTVNGDTIICSSTQIAAVSGGAMTIGQANRPATISATSIDLSSAPGCKVDIDRRRFAITSSTDGNHEGDVVYFGGTTSMTVGTIYNYSSAGAWVPADADDVATCDGLLAVALGAASDTNGMLLRGMVTLDHDPGAVGDVLFLSTTAGDATATAPSGNNDIVRIIGYCLNAAAGQIWFNPDNTFVKITA